MRNKQVENRKFFGYIPFVNSSDEFQVVAFTERSVRWYHHTVRRDYHFLDAAGSLFADREGHKKLLYYALVARHSFEGYARYLFWNLLVVNILKTPYPYALDNLFNIIKRFILPTLHLLK